MKSRCGVCRRLLWVRNEHNPRRDAGIRPVLGHPIRRGPWVNGEITKRRNTLINTPNQFDRGEAVSFVDFVENSIRDLGQWIDAIIRKLEY